MYIDPFTKIRVVSSKTSKCSVGSTGYMGFCDTVRIGYNMWDANLIITKIGKRGKPTLKSIHVNVPIVSPEIFAEEDQALLQEVKYVECLESLEYPKIRKCDVSKVEVDLEILPHERKNLIDGPIHDYLAFVLLLSMIIDRYSNKMHHAHNVEFTTTGKGRYNPEMNDPEKLMAMLVLDKAMVGKIIARAFYNKGEYIDRLMKVFNTRAFRFQVLETLWKQAAGIADWFNLYKETRLKQTALMLKHLSSIIMQWRRNPDCLETLRTSPNEVGPMCCIDNYPTDEWSINNERNEENHQPVLRGGFIRPVRAAVTRSRIAEPVRAGRSRHVPRPPAHGISNLVLERITEAPQITQDQLSYVIIPDIQDAIIQPASVNGCLNTDAHGSALAVSANELVANPDLDEFIDEEYDEDYPD